MQVSIPADSTAAAEVARAQNLKVGFSGAILVTNMAVALLCRGRYSS